MKPKVLMLLHGIPHYRIPIYNMIASHFDLTIASSSKVNVGYTDFLFDIIQIPVIKLGPFILQKKNIFKLAKNFDVVIALQNIRCLDLMILSLIKRRDYRLIYWGIGVSASYSKRFDSDKKFDFIRHYISRKADAVIFYSSYPINRYVNNGIKRDKIFVANNTVKLSDVNCRKLPAKDSLLFVGTLYKEKGLSELLNAYFEAYQNIGDKLLKLIIVGDGPERTRVEELINKKGLGNVVSLKGAIYNQELLKDYYLSSLACISPNQAGLSVLSSMGYGVPFITKRNAITGGESLNIKNGENGVLYNTSSELTHLLEDISLNQKKYLSMGIKARKYYSEFRTPEIMAKGIIDAINYTIEIRKSKK